MRNTDLTSENPINLILFGLLSFDPCFFFVFFLISLPVSDNTHSHTETLCHHWRAAVQLTVPRLRHWLSALKTPTATLSRQPMATHLPPLTQKSPPGESSVTEGRWGGWDHTRGEGVRGHRRRREGFATLTSVPLSPITD